MSKLDSCTYMSDIHLAALLPAVNISQSRMPNDQASVAKVARKLSVLQGIWSVELGKFNYWDKQGKNNMLS